MFYIDLFRTLDQHQVDYVLIGGLAVALHGIERNTMDIDIALVVSPANLGRMVDVARHLNMTPVLPVPLDSLNDVALLQQWHRERNMQVFALRSGDLAGVTLDILLFPPVDPHAMGTRCVVFDVASVPVRTASILDLIALKQAFGRPIYLADIAHLHRLGGAA